MERKRLLVNKAAIKAEFSRFRVGQRERLIRLTRLYTAKPNGQTILTAITCNYLSLESV